MPRPAPHGEYAETPHVVSHDVAVSFIQPRYNMLERQAEADVLPQASTAGAGVIAYPPLAQGLLTDKYLAGSIPADSRAAELRGTEWLTARLTETRRNALRRRGELAGKRGQSLAQLALAWILRKTEVTSVLMRASRVEQIEENVAAPRNPSFSSDELTHIDAVLASMEEA
jgi:L-glyceraldehyde 3-phosphate reductase